VKTILKMALIQNGRLGLAPKSLVLHGTIRSSIIRSSALFVYILRRMFSSRDNRHICLHIGG